MTKPPFWPAMLILSLAACSDRRSGNDVDVAAAASRGQSDIANYAATRPTAAPPKPTTAAVVPRRSGATAGPVVPAASTAAPLADDAAPDAVVRRYVEAIAARRYGEAWRLWEHRGAASGMTEAAFAASFARYASFDATVGAPFDEDAGAGQRYVTVPVTMTGTLASGAPFRLQGPVVLHRVARDIETDEPDAYAWRIRSSEMKSRPAGAGATPR